MEMVELEGSKFATYTCGVLTNGNKCTSTKPHKLLHGSTKKVINLVHRRNVVRQAIEEPEETIVFGTEDTLLQIQKIPFLGGKSGNVFWDGGATIVIIRHRFVEDLGLKGQEVIQRIQVCGRDFEDWETKAYWVIMIDRDGVKHKMKALGIDRITSDIKAVEV
jgi:hypothetical protein